MSERGRTLVVRIAGSERVRILVRDPSESESGPVRELPGVESATDGFGETGRGAAYSQAFFVG